MKALAHRIGLHRKTLPALAGICLLLAAPLLQAAEGAFALQAATALGTTAPTGTAASTPTAVPLVAPVVAPVLGPSETENRNSNVTSVDHTRETEDIWQRIRAGFAMRNLDGPVVDNRMNYYLARPTAIKVMLERSRKYLFHIVTELEKRGMPTELALLPVVESAYNPQALSSAKAAGLWQFIPSTGKSYQLEQNWWVDERRDIIASTDAALAYLQTIYEMHGDWHLALASYNWGENAVARAVARNKAAGLPTDYASLRMPEETRYYVPKLQAIKNIIAQPERYKVDLPDIPNQPFFTRVERVQRMDVAVAAKLAELPTTEFLMLNPGYNRPVLPGTKDASIVLPLDNARKFEENLSRHVATSDAPPLLTWKTWVVPKTSRIEQVAKELGMAVQSLCVANGLRARALLAAGYKLLVPSSISEPVPESLARLGQAASAKPAKYKAPKRGVTRGNRRKG
ncbi:MAG: transglycosylase SLT domain-containing protein [Rhodocyclaceae bacterium]